VLFLRRGFCRGRVVDGLLLALCLGLGRRRFLDDFLGDDRGNIAIAGVADILGDLAKLPHDLPEFFRIREQRLKSFGALGESDLAALHDATGEEVHVVVHFPRSVPPRAADVRIRGSRLSVREEEVGEVHRGLRLVRDLLVPVGLTAHFVLK